MLKNSFKTQEFNFSLPKELIALKPNYPRDKSKLLEVSKSLKLFSFSELTNLLNKGDCLIINDTKVIPGKLYGKCLNKNISITLNKLIKKEKTIIWSAFVNPLRKVKLNEEIFFSKDFFCKIIEIRNEGEICIEFKCSSNSFYKNINLYGELALPPYILKKRKFIKDDNSFYQTIFAKKNGAVAAPTASLHFSKNLLKIIKLKGIKIVKVTLHVNGGTFLPIKTQNIDNHQMHFEWGRISKKSANLINMTRKSGKKCVAVGTTVLRLMESAKKKNGELKEFEGETNIFIKPGWKVNTIDGLITNFHTPKSTLFVLVCSLLGINKAKSIYNYAIEKKLKFFSYGDSCLIWI